MTKISYTFKWPQVNLIYVILRWKNDPNNSTIKLQRTTIVNKQIYKIFPKGNLLIVKSIDIIQNSTEFCVNWQLHGAIVRKVKCFCYISSSGISWHLFIRSCYTYTIGVGVLNKIE